MQEMRLDTPGFSVRRHSALNIHQLHAQLSDAVRNASRLRDELAAPNNPLLYRLIGRLRYAYFMAYVQTLTRQLHTN